MFRNYTQTFDSINRLRKGRTYVAIGIQLLILGHYKLLNLSKMQNRILVGPTYFNSMIGRPIIFKEECYKNQVEVGMWEVTPTYYRIKSDIIRVKVLTSQHYLAGNLLPHPMHSRPTSILLRTHLIIIITFQPQ